VAGQADVPVRVRIAPLRRWPGIDLQELWSYRGLFLFLVWRDIRVRYAQSALGAGWAILQPLLAMVVFTIIFGRFAGIPSDGAPYAVFAFAALVPWSYFATALTGASNSLVGNTPLITKVYCPRLVIPFAPVLAALVDFGVAFAVLLLLLALSGIVPAAAALLAVPLLTLVALLTAAGAGCWLAALNIQYRDVKHLTPFLVQIWMYSSPIVYPLSVIPAEYRAVYALNPLVGVVTGFRSVLLHTVTFPWTTVLISLASSVLLFVSGAVFFRHMERIFADVA
jgi:lipopolysaccharide transport system permease protein